MNNQVPLITESEMYDQLCLYQAEHLSDESKEQRRKAGVDREPLESKTFFVVSVSSREEHGEVAVSIINPALRKIDLKTMMENGEVALFRLPVDQLISPSLASKLKDLASSEAQQAAVATFFARESGEDAAKAIIAEIVGAKKSGRTVEDAAKAIEKLLP